MKTIAMQYAVTIGLTAVLALTTAIPSSAQMRAGRDDGYTAQYCVSPQEDGADAQKVYCEGWRAIRKNW